MAGMLVAGIGICPFQLTSDVEGPRKTRTKVTKRKCTELTDRRRQAAPQISQKAKEMSADAKKKHRGFSKAKGAAPAAGATSADAKKNGTLRGVGEPERGAGICTKCVFFLLLVTFSVLVTVNMVDYKAGQLKEAYLKHVPEEVRQILAIKFPG